MKLKLFNVNEYRGRGHYYIAANSIGDCATLMSQATTLHYTPNDVRTIFNKNCWGRSMDGIKPVRGVWFQKNNSQDPPVKLI